MATTNQVPYAEFGQRLSDLRKAAGMTRQDLCKKCSIAQSTLSNYEKGLRIPYADTAVKMAQAFGLTVEELLGMENPELTMANEEAIDGVRAINGNKGAARLRKIYLEAAHLAGGDLTDEQLMEFSMEMQKMALIAQQKLNERYTSKRYQDTVRKKAEQTAEAVEKIDNAIASLQSGDPQK